MLTAIGKHAEFEFDAAADVQPMQSLTYGRCDGAHPQELKLDVVYRLAAALITPSSRSRSLKETPLIKPLQ